MMNNDDILKKCDEVIQEPLLTEDGFLNEACMNELASVINNMPYSYERFKDNPEWSVPCVTNIKYITGAFAQWSVRQLHETPYPPNLEKLIGYLDACLRKEFLKKEDSKWNQEGWGKFSLCEVNKMLHDFLWEDPTFNEWNSDKVLGDNWLDIEALLHNVCLSIRDERRDNDRFDAEFEKKHGKFGLGETNDY